MSRIRTIGMLGAGQLGRMSALAGYPLGINTHVFAPEGPNSPAMQVCPLRTVAPYEDEAALARFAESVEAITYEFENIPLATIKFLEKIRPVYPSSDVLEMAQERLAEKTSLNYFGLPTTRYGRATCPDDVIGCLEEWGVEQCIIKTTRFGYDGKGQALIRCPHELEAAWASLNADVVIVEDVVDFSHEISVIVARDRFGEAGCYTPGLNVHKNHILHTTSVPAPLPAGILANAQSLAIELARKIDLVGVMGVEMFVTKERGLLINEIAPRPHNSGHWTIDACACSQFEQQMRCVAGLPLGPFKRHAEAIMTNLLGEDILSAPQLLRDAGARFHDYGKAEIKPGRKMGHVTLLK